MYVKREDTLSYLSVLAISMTLHIIIFYLFYYLSGKYFNRSRVKWYIILFIPFILVYSVPATWVFMKAYHALIHLGYIKDETEIMPLRVTYFSVVTTQSLYATIGALMSLSFKWYNGQKKQEELEKQNITNELALLKSQVNPHFLFNTLNNLHSFVSREPDKTAFGIIKLSEIMRYMLYETNTDKVLLENEVAYITNYIELQRLRLKDPNFIDFKIDGDIQGKLISPLFLITLIENAFKHGSKNAPIPGITVSLKVESNSLNFEVTNYLASKSDLAIAREGFGLKNLQRRLDLIYGSQYNLETSIKNGLFNVILKINNLK
jgi:LytS/YehU family sensor histidine kinase